jgi:penicillin-binding protein 1A
MGHRKSWHDACSIPMTREHEVRILAQDRSTTCDAGPWQLAESVAVASLPLVPLRVDEPSSRGETVAARGRAVVAVVRTGLLTLARGLRRALLPVARAASAVGRYRAVRIALAGASALVLTTSSALAYRIYFDRRELPNLEAFIRFEPPTTGVIYELSGGSLIEVAHEYRRVVSYEQVPEVLRQAVLAAEDKNFFAHNGVEYGALPRIVWKSVRDSIAAWRHGGESARVRLPQGGSTLTQQLVRGYFLQQLASGENGQTLAHTSVVARVLATAIGVPATNKLARKLEEVRLSLWLEGELGRRFGSKERAKREIFARYASFIYLGNGRYGFAAASDYYLDKPLASYGPADAANAALLAGIGKSPREYAPEPGNLSALRRRNRILALMARNGYVALPLAEACQKEPLRVVARSPIKTHAPAAVETVFDELKRFGGPSFGVEDLFMGRIAVYSTVDARIQALVNAALEQGLEAYEKRHPHSKGLIQGSVVVLRNADGGILAEAGGRQRYKERSTLYGDFNRATQALRQPGSAMKPLVYLAALQHGLALDTLVPDMPIAVPLGGNRGLKWISNYDDRFKGMIPLREALAQSRNSVAIWIALQVGMPSVLKLAREMGIHTPLQPYVTTALGASEVNLLELAGVYRTMATGIVAEPHVIARIDGPSGELLYSAPPPAASASTDALRSIQEGLRGVVRLPGGTAHALDTPGFPPVMGKTGTSSDFRDALFVGSTYGAQGITVAVRVGFDDNRALGDRETGGRAALPVFRQIMLGVYEKQWLGPAPRFPQEIEASIDGYLTVRAAAPPPPTEDVAPTAVMISVSMAAEPPTGAVATAAVLDPQVQPAR